jgi:hypothetical protein
MKIEVSPANEAGGDFHGCFTDDGKTLESNAQMTEVVQLGDHAVEVCQDQRKRDVFLFGETMMF